jgi:REP element-mobilizing transposase RayT
VAEKMVRTMPRRLRVHFAGAIYHVSFRGNERKAIFRDDADRTRMIETLARQSEKHGVRCYLVCLMPNHVHLLLETPRANLSAFMAGLLTAYTVYFNHRHHRAGHLMQGRFKAQMVEGNEYLLKLTRYIHLNPVRIQRLASLPVGEQLAVLRSYRWSTYRSYAGLEAPWPWVDYGPVLDLAGTWAAGTDDVACAYRAFVETGLAENDGEFNTVYGNAAHAVGSDSFVREVAGHHRKAAHASRRPGDVAFRREHEPVSAGPVIAAVVAVLGVPRTDLTRRQRDSTMRSFLAAALSRHTNLNQRAIAKHIGLTSGAAVSALLRRWHGILSKEASWQQAEKRVAVALNL